MVRIFTSLFVFFLLVSTVHAQVVLDNDATPEGTVSVQPMDHDLNLKRGETKEFKLYVSNKSFKKMSFSISLSDWMRDSVGAHIYSPPGTEAHSCTSWITFDKNFIEVDTNKVGVVNVKVHMPDSAGVDDGMRWSMIFIQSVEETKAPPSTKVATSYIQQNIRFGVHINQTPAAILSQKDFKLISFTPMPNEKSKFRILGENTGKVELLCKSYIELSSIPGGTKTKLLPLEVPVFPGAKRYFDFTLPSDLSKGKYTMVGVVDAGGDMDIMAAQMTINIQ